MIGTTEALTRILSPRSVAVIGASDRTGNRGGTAASYLRKFGYAGEVYPVHPTADTVAGFPAYPTIQDLPADIDLAIIALGVQQVSQTVLELGAAGIRAAVVWAGGFAETGNTAGQRELLEAGKRAGVRILGPNCLGVVNTELNFTGTFATWLKFESHLTTTGISMVSQSGGLASFAHAWSQRDGIGLRMMVSTGNAADISLNDVLDYFIEDTGTRVILCYLEGTTDGPRLLETLKRAREAGKPVVMLKVGHSEASTKAIAAHTGSLAGETRVWDALLEAEGVIQAQSLEQLLEIGHYLQSREGRPGLTGNRIAILSFGGGMGVLAADQSGSAGLQVPTLSGELQARLRNLAPDIASVSNPLDLTPEMFTQPQWRERLPQLLREIDESDEVDIILTQFSTGESVFPEEVAGAVAALHARGLTHVVAYSRDAGDLAAAMYRDSGAHTFTHQQVAVNTIGLIAAARDRCRHDAEDILARTPESLPLPPGFAVPNVKSDTVLPEHAVHELLATAGFSTLKARTATTREEAVRFATSIGFPVVMKGLSERVTHRAAAGLVYLNVSSAEAAGDAWDALQARGTDIEAELVGVMIEEQANGGVELLVSAITDPVFGPLISCGAGGVLTEMLEDVSFVRGPLDEGGALKLLDRLNIAHHPKGIDLSVAGPSAVAFLVQFSRFIESIPWSTYVVELNPVAVTAEHATPLDGLIIVQDTAPHGEERDR